MAVLAGRLYILEFNGNGDAFDDYHDGLGKSPPLAVTQMLGLRIVAEHVLGCGPSLE